MINQILMKWQLFFESLDNGDHHLEFSKICTSDIINMFQIEVLIFPLILATMGQILKKWQQFFTIHDGGSRHRENYTFG